MIPEIGLIHIEEGITSQTHVDPASSFYESSFETNAAKDEGSQATVTLY